MNKRVSLILGDLDMASISPFVQSGTDQFDALQRWAARHGESALKSEASALRALLRAGVEALRDDILEQGYAELASIYGSDVERAERRVARDRYAARTDANV